jgi:hypothetical protein
MGEQIETYHQGRLTFILTPDKIAIRTSLNQTFFLNPKAHYWKRRIATIRIMVQLGEIRDLNELAVWCGHGIEWVDTRQVFELDSIGQPA